MGREIIYGRYYLEYASEAELRSLDPQVLGLLVTFQSR